MDLKSLNKLGFHTMKVFSHFLASSFYPMFVKFIPFSVPFNEFLQDNFSLWLWFWLLSWIFVLLSWVWHWCEAENGLSQLGIFWGADFGIILNLGYPVAIIMVTLEDVIIRSSYSHPDLLLINPTFSGLACLPLYNYIGISLSEPLQLYQKQSLDSSAGYMYTLCAR